MAKLTDYFKGWGSKMDTSLNNFGNTLFGGVPNKISNTLNSASNAVKNTIGNTTLASSYNYLKNNPVVNPTSPIQGPGGNVSVTVVAPPEKKILDINPAGAGVELPTPPALPIDTGEFITNSKASIAKTQAAYDEALKAREDFMKNTKSAEGTKPEEEKKMSFWEKLFSQKEEIKAPDETTYEGFLKKWGWTTEDMVNQKALETELTGYQSQILDLEQQKQATLNNREMAMQGRATSAWKGESALIDRKFNNDIAAVAAKGTLTQMKYDFATNNMKNAESLANQYMQFATYKYQQDLADLDFIKDVYKDMTTEEDNLWTRLRTEKQDVFDNVLKTAQYNLDVFKAEQTKSAADAEASTIQNTLDKNRGTDVDVCPGGCVDPGVYMNQRTLSKMGPTEFDNRFAHLLSPQERANLGISIAKTTSASQKEMEIWQQMDTPDVQAMSDDDKAAWIRQNGLDPATFGL